MVANELLNAKYNISGVSMKKTWDMLQGCLLLFANAAFCSADMLGLQAQNS